MQDFVGESLRLESYAVTLVGATTVLLLIAAGLFQSLWTGASLRKYAPGYGFLGTLVFLGFFAMTTDEKSAAVKAEFGRVRQAITEDNYSVVDYWQTGDVVIIYADRQPNFFDAGIVLTRASAEDFIRCGANSGKFEQSNETELPDQLIESAVYDAEILTDGFPER